MKIGVFGHLLELVLSLVGVETKLAIVIVVSWQPYLEDWIVMVQFLIHSFATLSLVQVSYKLPFPLIDNYDQRQTLVNYEAQKIISKKVCILPWNKSHTT